MEAYTPRNHAGIRRLSPEWWAAWTIFDPATGCLNWDGFRCPEGRGRMHYKGKGGVLVYRVAFEQAYGPINPKLKVCHSCDNPSCVNVDHLFLGTQKDNLRDMFAKGRARPRGRTPRDPAVATVAATLLPASDGGIRCVSRCHSTSYEKKSDRTNCRVAAPAWCRVTGVPTIQPTRAIVLYTPPRKWTPNLSTETVGGYRAVATVAPGCHQEAAHG